MADFIRYEDLSRQILGHRKEMLSVEGSADQVRLGRVASRSFISQRPDLIRSRAQMLGIVNDRMLLHVMQIKPVCVYCTTDHSKDVWKL